MAQLVYKPRPKMRTWTPPQVPKPKRSHFYLWSVLGWFGVLAVGYYWLPIDWEQREAEPAPVAPDLGASVGTSHAPELVEQRNSADSRTPREAPALDPPDANALSSGATTRASTEILPCEAFTQGGRVTPESRLPTHLERSAVDAFIGPNDWARPCRGKHRRVVHLCVAIENGSVRGLSAKTGRADLTLETCLREQAKKLVLPPEETLRVVNTTFSL